MSVPTTWQWVAPAGGTQEARQKLHVSMARPRKPPTYHRLGKIPERHRVGGDCTRAGTAPRGGCPGTFGEAGLDLCGGGWGASEMAFLVDLGAPLAAVCNGKTVVLV